MNMDQEEDFGEFTTSLTKKKFHLLFLELVWHWREIKKFVLL